jgi:hypothetical protein
MTKRQAPLWPRQLRRSLSFACVLACKSPVDDPAPPAQCEPLQLELVQQFDQDDLIELFSGKADDLPEHQGPGLAMGDLNGDGFWDAFLSVRSAGTIAFLNDGTGQFSVLDDLLVDGGPLPEANSVALADMDADGDLDLAMATQDGQPNLILVNKGDGTRWDSIVLENSLGEALTPTWADLNGDGRLDLVMPGFSHKFPDPQGRPHRLYFQDEDGEFHLDRTALPENARTGMTFVSQPFDVDLDGDLDLYWANELPFYSQLLLNDGNGKFTDYSEDCFCTEIISAMGIAVGDPTLDGLPDFFVTGWQENRFFVNDGDGGFFDAADTVGLVPAKDTSSVGWGVRFTDFDLDGLPDLAGTFGGPTHDPDDHPKIQYDQNDTLWVADRQGGFTDQSAEAAWTTQAKGRGLFVADMNRDGRPDLVLATNIGLEIWLTKGGCGESLSLTLNGGSGDPHGEGARVRIEQADGAVHYEWMQSAVSFGNAAPELYLGNPATNEIVDLEVQWANGQVQSIPIPKESPFFSFQRE